MSFCRGGRLYRLMWLQWRPFLLNQRLNNNCLENIYDFKFQKSHGGFYVTKLSRSHGLLILYRVEPSTLQVDFQMASKGSRSIFMTILRIKKDSMLDLHVYRTTNLLICFLVTRPIQAKTLFLSRQFENAFKIFVHWCAMRDNKS